MSNICSKGQVKIRSILEYGDFEFEEEYSFKDLRAKSSSREMPFDFVVFYDEDHSEDNIEFAIEVQGEQHYKAVNAFGGKKKLKRQQYNDNHKKRFCAAKNIKLIQIPYTALNDYNLEKLMIDMDL